MKRNLKVFLGGSTVALLGILAVPKPASSTPTPSAPPGAAAAVRAGEALDEAHATLELLAAQAERTSTLAWSRDPFALPVVDAMSSSVATLPGLAAPRYQGLAILDGRALALVGPEIVGVGDRLASGHRIVSIEPDHLVLEHEGRMDVLPLTQAPAEQ